ncbi:hypothetical protein [Bradyrhizobium sp. CCGB01]|uniref:hypothetical protein n=1 Tax=Bradyrhizobium sp. CCGB01 TaxID=2949634 RepID=UPI0020B3D914|nr:hypothetical protein [Bradyrhizobium sp. CCGB01]MCP3409916.1 hypothetical protein [Bradyrhizobium sp. CCGB01]
MLKLLVVEGANYLHHFSDACIKRDASRIVATKRIKWQRPIRGVAFDAVWLQHAELAQ